jgi:type IV secretion system protein VirD4
MTGAADDPANSSIRREPELPEHEEIAPRPRKLAQEFEHMDDESDDDAQRRRAMQRQIRVVARQVALDPADHMGL